MDSELIQLKKRMAEAVAMLRELNDCEAIRKIIRKLEWGK